MSHPARSSARGNLSLVVSVLALLVATSGTAYALANGSVKTKHLAANAVTTPKIKDGAVSSTKIKAAAVTAPKIGTGAVTSPKLGVGAVTETRLGAGAVTGPKLADGAVGEPSLGEGAVTGPKLGDGAVTGPKLAPNAVTGASVEDGSLGLSDLGGAVTDQVTLVPAAISIPVGQCRDLFLALYNPAPAAILGSMVVGTITSSTGGAVVSNAGSVLPTLVTSTTQGGAIPHLVVCAGGSAQTIPADSVVTWSLIAP